MSVCLLVDHHAHYDQAAACTWQSAMALWQIDLRTCSLDEIESLPLPGNPLLVVDGFAAHAHLPWEAIASYVRRGGSLLLTGLPGQSYPAGVQALRELTGVTALRPGSPGDGFPSLKVAAGLASCTPWNEGEVLFFTNPAFSASASQAFGCIESFVQPASHILATLYWTTALPQAGSEVFSGFASSQPGMLSFRPYPHGGQVIYTPLPLGLIQSVLTPQQIEVDHYPYPVANHGLYLLLRSLVLALLAESALPTPWLALWPAGVSAVVCLTGDVHEFHFNPSGNARREYSYIQPMADLIAGAGAPGKFTFYVTGLLAEKHPEALQSACDWDFGGHTYSDTGFVDASPPGYDPKGDSDPEAPDLTIGRPAQSQDIALTAAALQKAVPGHPEWSRNWRTHYVASTAVTRDVLAEQGMLSISDTGLYWPGEWQPDRFGGQALVTYVAYPQRAVSSAGLPLPLWEMGECIPSDYALWVSSQRHPAQPYARVMDAEGAFQTWTSRIERAWRCEEQFVVIWHPYHSLQTPERADALRRTMAFVRSLPGMVFMNMTEAARWWDQRSQVSLRVVEKSAASLTLELENCAAAALQGVSVPLLLPVGCRLAEIAAAPELDARLEALPSPRSPASLAVCLHLPALSRQVITLRFSSTRDLAALKAGYSKLN